MVFKIKYQSDRFIELYKDQLVVCGDPQLAGLDYNETFVLVAKMVSV